jgi:hypothetical protein
MNRSRTPHSPSRHLAVLGLACKPEMIFIVETDPSTEAFTYVHYADGSVVISHDGNAATLLRGDRAATFLTEVAVSKLSRRAGPANTAPAWCLSPEPIPASPSADHH